MITFLLWLCFCGVDDFRNRKARNWVVIIGLTFAFVASAMGPEIHPLRVGFGESLTSALLCFFIFLIFYISKQMGAGDVKFGTALAAFVGFDFLLPIWALSCAFAVVHGLLSKYGRSAFLMQKEIDDDGGSGYIKFIPYVTYLSLSTVIVMGFCKN